MDKAYWLSRWEQQDTGFHQSEINPYLREFWPHLQLSPASTVLVPLCGKSLDFHWLHQQGQTVLGVELNIIAARAFFAENELTPHCSTDGRFTHLTAGSMQILCGDLFDLNPKDTVTVSAVYDRSGNAFSHHVSVARLKTVRHRHARRDYDRR